MSTSAAQAEAFRSEISASSSVWTVEDAGGFPAPMGRDGRRTTPFWSRSSKAQKIIDTSPAYASFVQFDITLDAWRKEWLPDLTADDFRAGVDWSGIGATGYDLEPAGVEAILVPRPRKSDE